MTDRPEQHEAWLPAETSGGEPLTVGSYGQGRIPAPEPPLIDWRRYLGALVRFKWLVILSPFVGVALAFPLNHYLKPDYATQATIWIENANEQKGPEIAPIRQQELLRAYSWVELLKSTLVLDLVVEQLRLYLKWSDPADSVLFQDLRIREPFRTGKYRLALNEAGDSVTLFDADRLIGWHPAIEQAAVGDSLGRNVGILWAPPRTALTPGRTVKFSIEAPRAAAQTLSRALRPSTDRIGNFLRVELTGKDPRQIAAIVNAVVERYVEVAADLKREKVTELARILNEQLQQAERSLREAENALESFRVQTITLPTERATPVSPGLQSTQAPVLSNFFTMRIDLDGIRQDRLAIERALVAETGSRVSTDALEAVGAVQQSELAVALRELTAKRAELRAMRYRYSPQHPPVQQLAQAIDTLENRTVPALARGLLAELTAREADLNARIGSASRELRQIPPRMIQEARLDRQVRIADNLFGTLQHRYQEARLAEVSSIPDVRILEAAPVPQLPLNNLALYLLLGGLAGGLGLGLVLALLLEHLDRRVRYPNQVTAGMGLPILGAVPHLKARANGVGAASLIEAFRGVELNLVYAHATTDPLVLTVTSPSAGDGKSFVAANLALAFADAGHTTVLVDGDIRRGDLNRVMATPQTPGLTDVLAHAVPLDSTILQTEFTHLQFIASGTRMSRGPELLSSGAMSGMLNTLRTKYSVIIVDSPPLGAGIDAYALSAAAGNLLVVLRAGVTNRQVAEAKLHLLDRLPVRIFGAVLNDVRQGGRYSTYSYYMAGYEYPVDAEGPGGPKQLLGSGPPSRKARVDMVRPGS